MKKFNLFPPRITIVNNNQLCSHLNNKMLMATNEVKIFVAIVCVQFLLEKCLTRLVIAVKFDKQAGYHLPNHSSMTCCMLADFHSNDGACSTGKGIGSWQSRGFSRRERNQ